jgi:hypothetical protein
MTQRLSATSARTFFAFVVGSLAVVHPAMADQTGCSDNDKKLPAALACFQQTNRDIFEGKPYIHVIRCDSSGLRCCMQQDRTVSNCGPASPTHPDH